jgi:hypothetical protein
MEGVMECADCKVSLVDVLPPKEKTLPKARLKQATLLAIFGILFVFLYKTANTIFPKMYTILILAQVLSVLFILARLTGIYFFVCFLREYVRPGQKTLKTAVYLTIIGGLALTLLSAIGTFSIFTGTNPIGYGIHYELLYLLIHFAAAGFILYYFIVFHREVLNKKLMKLKKATYLAIIGSIIFVLIHSASLINYFAFLIQGSQTGLSANTTILLVIGFLTIPFATFTYVNFFFTFYKGLKTS